MAVRPLSRVAEVAVEYFWCQNDGKISLTPKFWVIVK